jgi:predicted SprT family Zn-dependent metalloprotease
MHFVMSPVVTDNHVIDVILHEVAHALAGPFVGHGPTWKTIAKEIGCSANRCVDIDFASHLAERAFVCVGCDKHWPIFRMSKKMHKHNIRICPSCRGLVFVCAKLGKNQNGYCDSR